jgi:hypothetical protein
MYVKGEPHGTATQLEGQKTILHGELRVWKCELAGRTASSLVMKTSNLKWRYDFRALMERIHVEGVEHERSIERFCRL